MYPIWGQLDQIWPQPWPHRPALLPKRQVLQHSSQVCIDFIFIEILGSEARRLDIYFTLTACLSAHIQTSLSTRWKETYVVKYHPIGNMQILHAPLPVAIMGTSAVSALLFHEYKYVLQQSNTN